MMTVATSAVGCLGKVVVLALCFDCVAVVVAVASTGVLVWPSDLGCVRFLGRVAGVLFANPRAL